MNIRDIMELTFISDSNDLLFNGAEKGIISEPQKLPPSIRAQILSENLRLDSSELLVPTSFSVATTKRESFWTTALCACRQTINEEGWIRIASAVCLVVVATGIFLTIQVGLTYLLVEGIRFDHQKIGRTFVNSGQIHLYSRADFLLDACWQSLGIALLTFYNAGGISRYVYLRLQSEPVVKHFHHLRNAHRTKYTWTVNVNVEKSRSSKINFATLANNCEDGEWIDPISLEPLNARKAIVIGNYAFSLKSALNTMVSRYHLAPHSADSYYQHPVENRRLEEADKNQFLTDLSKIFCTDKHTIDKIIARSKREANPENPIMDAMTHHHPTARYNEINPSET